MSAGVRNVAFRRADALELDEPATYDLLPSGGTGFYWANGVLLASTLANP